MHELWRFVGVFSHCETFGSQSFLFSCALHSADAIMIARAQARAGLFMTIEQDETGFVYR